MMSTVFMRPAFPVIHMPKQGKIIASKTKRWIDNLTGPIKIAHGTRRPIKNKSTGQGVFLLWARRDSTFRPHRSFSLNPIPAGEEAGCEAGLFTIMRRTPMLC